MQGECDNAGNCKCVVSCSENGMQCTFFSVESPATTRGPHEVWLVLVIRGRLWQKVVLPGDTLQLWPTSISR